MRLPQTETVRTLTVTYIFSFPFFFYLVLGCTYLPHSFFSMPPFVRLMPLLFPFPRAHPRLPHSLVPRVPYGCTTHTFSLPSFVTTNDEKRRTRTKRTSKSSGQYMVGRFLCARFVVSQTSMRDETETQITANGGFTWAIRIRAWTVHAAACSIL